MDSGVQLDSRKSESQSERLRRLSQLPRGMDEAGTLNKRTRQLLSPRSFMNGTLETKERTDHEKHRRSPVDWPAKKCLGISPRFWCRFRKEKGLPHLRRWGARADSQPFDPPCFTNPTSAGVAPSRFASQHHALYLS